MDKGIHETYAGLEGRELLEPLIRDFRGRLAVVSSFGAESAVLLHMVAQVDKATPIIFLDTGKLFWETLSYRSMLIDRRHHMQQDRRFRAEGGHNGGAALEVAEDRL